MSKSGKNKRHCPIGQCLLKQARFTIVYFFSAHGFFAQGFFIFSFFFAALATLTFTLSPTFTSAMAFVSLTTVILDSSVIAMTFSPFFVFTVIVFALTSTAVTSPLPLV